MKRKVTSEEFDAAYKQWQPLIIKKTNLWCKKMSKDEAHQIACVALWKSLVNYKSGKSKFITYLFSYMNWEYMNKMDDNKRGRIKAKLCDPSTYSFDMDCMIEDKKQDFVEEEINILRKYLNEQENYVLSKLLDGNRIIEIAKKKGVTKQRIDQIHQRIRYIADDLTRRGQIRIL